MLKKSYRISKTSTPESLFVLVTYGENDEISKEELHKFLALPRIIMHRFYDEKCPFSESKILWWIANAVATIKTY